MKKERKSLVESLIEEGIITFEQLKEVEEEERRSGLNLRKALVKMGLVSEDDLVAFLSNKLGITQIVLESYIIDPKIIDLVPEGLARKYELIPVLKIGNRLSCAMVDPWNVFALDELRAKTGLIIEPMVATQTEIKRAIDEYYTAKGTIEEVILAIDKEKVSVKDADVKGLEAVVEEPAVIRLVNLVISRALAEGSSDIHIEPEKETLNIRFRVDGLLHQVFSPPKHLQSAIISRIKIMSGLDIAERRVPQDGRFNIKLESREVDVRVSCVPSIYGESLALRLLDVSGNVLTLEQLGFSRDVMQDYLKLISHPYGMILVTGPTGSGKTSTLYASLSKINSVDKNIITIEDPVEYHLPGVRQIQVNAKVDLTFANGLRAILRQDPNVIMVGEIRDAQAAEIAVQAALTGHMVFSTLHTNDAPSAIVRLADMKIEPFLISSSLIGVLAQRLVRKICKECKEDYAPDEEMLKELGLGDKAKGVKFYRGKGCPKCLNTGYKGRLALFELMVLNENLRRMIVNRMSASEIRKEAYNFGMVGIKEDGVEKAKSGFTTLDEVLRITQEE